MNDTQTPRTDAAESNWWSEDGLRSAFIVRAEFARELEREIARLTDERDEARRMYCEEAFCHRFNERGGEGTITDPRQIAHSMGWDCFKENTNE